LLLYYLQAPVPVVERMKVDSGLITINVQTLSGSLPPIMIPAESTVRYLKLRVQSLNSDFAFDLQKLLTNESGNSSEGEVQQVVLQNHRTLHSYQITESANVLLVMLSKPNSVVCIGSVLKDSKSIQQLLQNGNLHGIAINAAQVCGDENSKFNLLQLYEQNRAIRSIDIICCWTQQFQFCQTLHSLRPDIDIRFDVFRSDNRDKITKILRILEICTVNHCSSFKLCAQIGSMILNTCLCHPRCN
jgi:hypothetical protein